jgi:dTMP kinase
MGNSARFITFEGIDGAGKSTHIEALAQRFRSAGRTVLVTREPGGTALAEKIRNLVLHDAMDPLTEALLVFAARRDHLVQLIEPAVERGDVVLCDRFTDSSFAYQGGGRGLDLAVLSTLEQWVQGGRLPAGGPIRQPDLTLWFDLSPVQAARRLAAAREPDKFEAQNEAFFARVAQGFQSRAEAQPDRFFRLDADRDRAVVWADVEAAVRSRGWLE